MRIPRTVSGSALGAALLGWRALGAISSLEDAQVLAQRDAQERTVYPDPDITRRLSTAAG